MRTALFGGPFDLRQILAPGRLRARPAIDFVIRVAGDETVGIDREENRDGVDAERRRIVARHGEPHRLVFAVRRGDRDQRLVGALRGDGEIDRARDESRHQAQKSDQKRFGFQDLAFNCLLFGRRARAGAEAALDVIDHHLLEVGGQRRAAQAWRLSCRRQRPARSAVSPVPGSEMPISACLLSPGPLTMQPMTATLSVSTPG